jgi:hypothetical protein
MNRTVPATYKLLERAEKRFYEVGIKLGIPPPSNSRVNRSKNKSEKN